MAKLYGVRFTMLNFSKEVCRKKERDIKSTYSPIKFKKNYNVYSVERMLALLFNYSQTNDTVDALTGKFHCDEDRGRSYYDAYRLCMHYFPDMSFFEMYYILKKAVDPCHKRYIKRRARDLKLEPNAYAWYIQCSFWTCPNIGRARFCGAYKIKFK